MATKKTSGKTGKDSSASIGFEAKLWLAADQLRNNMDADIDIFDHGHRHHPGESATHPIEPRCGALAALLALQAAASQSSAPSTRPSLHRNLGAAAFSLASTPHRSPLGHVQLPNLG